MTASIFVSYASADRDYVERLASLRQLEPQGAAAAAPSPPMARTTLAAITPRRPVPAGSVFVPPRQPGDNPPVAAPQPQAAPSAVTTRLSSSGDTGARAAQVTAPATPRAAAVTKNDAPRTASAAAAVALGRSAGAPSMPPAANRIIGLLCFLLFGAAFVMVLSNELQRAQTPFLELFFWAVLLTGCTRLFSAILRTLVRATRQLAPSGG